MLNRFAALALIVLISLTTGCAGLGASAGKASPPTTQPDQRLRVMTYNIHHGRGDDGEVDLQRIAEVINREDVDLVALQEVDVNTNRSGNIDEPAVLARLTNMHHARFGKARDYDGGLYGQAILSRFPIENFEVHLLPGEPEEEQRIALAAHIPGEGSRPDLLLVGTHLHHADEQARIAQVKRLIEILEARQTPAAIITGDLNATPGSPPMDLLLEDWEDTSGEDALTYPATQPDRKIDWLLLPADLNWRVVESYVVDEPVASDHRPLVVELELVGSS